MSHDLAGRAAEQLEEHDGLRILFFSTRARSSGMRWGTGRTSPSIARWPVATDFGFPTGSDVSWQAMGATDARDGRWADEVWSIEQLLNRLSPRNLSTRKGATTRFGSANKV